MTLTWITQPNIIENKTMFGSSLAYINIRAANTPFGSYWIACEVLLNANNQPMNEPIFTIMAPNRQVIGNNFKKVEDALMFAEKDFAEKLNKLDEQKKQSDAQVELKARRQEEVVRPVTKK